MLSVEPFVKNVPIAGKVLTILALFGAFVIAMTVYTGFEMMRLETAYRALIDGRITAASQLASANRMLQATRAALAEQLLARTEADRTASRDEIAFARQRLEATFGDSIRALPEDATLGSLRKRALTLLDGACNGSDGDAGFMTEFLGTCRPAIAALSKDLTDKRARIYDAARTESAALAETTTRSARNTGLLTLAALVLVLAGGYAAIRAWVVRPAERLNASMLGLAEGHLDTGIEGETRRDEIGAMARALTVFRSNARLAAATEAEAVRQRTEAARAREDERLAALERADQLADVTASLGNGLTLLAAGHLGITIDHAFAPELDRLRLDFNACARRLAETVSQVSGSALAIDAGSREMAAAAGDLARRTAEQAAALEETAAALDQITSNVSSSSRRAAEARAVALAANRSAEAAEEVVGRAENAMRRIDRSSGEIASIIGVIDEIAFQTNLLALNAGVEAARAGEAGKGFAVVAQEVRDLAQRSAAAAREIKVLIHQSAGEVETGVKLVGDTGEALRAIESHVAAINQHIDSIATAASEQSIGLMEVNRAVNQMDQMTQQNAAMVEESNAATATLSLETGRLSALVSAFRLDERPSARHQESPALRRAAR